MSAVDVLNILDRQIGNNYNAAPSYEQLCEARAAVAELIDACRAAITDEGMDANELQRLRDAFAGVGAVA